MPKYKITFEPSTPVIDLLGNALGEEYTILRVWENNGWWLLPCWEGIDGYKLHGRIISKPKQEFETESGLRSKMLEYTKESGLTKENSMYF